MPDRPASARRPYESLPATVRDWVDERLSSTVVEARTQTGGFSAGVAARLRTADGGRAFVKAVGPEPNPDTPTLFRTEAAALRVLAVPALAGLIAPLLDDYDDGTWVALLLADVDGCPPAVPFRPDEIAAVSSGLDRLAAALDHVQVDTPLPHIGDKPDFWRRWEAAASEPDRLDPWTRAHQGTLLELTDHARTAMTGDALLHYDIRSDNVLLTGPPGHQQAVFVDWAWLRRGARWCDAALFAYELASDDPAGRGPALAEEFVSGSATLRDVPARDLSALIATIAGVMVAGSFQPPPPGLPTMRTFQARMGNGGLAWLRHRSSAGAW